MWTVGGASTFLRHIHTLLLSGVGFALMDVINDEMRHGEATRDTAVADKPSNPPTPTPNHPPTNKSNHLSADVLLYFF